MHTHTCTRVRRVSSKGPWSGLFKVSTTLNACPLSTAICLANIRSLKSASSSKNSRSFACVSVHHFGDVNIDRKWSRVLAENGFPMSETGKKSQLNTRKRWSGKVLESKFTQTENYATGQGVSKERPESCQLLQFSASGLQYRLELLLVMWKSLVLKADTLGILGAKKKDLIPQKHVWVSHCP